MMMGDFNLHIDNTSTDSQAGTFMDLTGRPGLSQHVESPTHRCGHILDLVLTTKRITSSKVVLYLMSSVIISR